MKRTVLLFVFLLALLLCACDTDPGAASTPTDTTAEPMKTVYVHGSITQTYGDTTTRTDYRYDENHRLTRVSITTGDTLTHEYRVTCDKNGNPIQWVGDMDHACATIEYTYDDQGHPLGTYAYSDGQLMTATEYTWGNGLRVSVTARAPGQDYERRTEYSYDENNLLFRQDLYINGTLTSYTICQCDDTGRLTESRNYDVEGKLLNTVLYTYDSTAETRITVDSDGETIQTQELTYDDHGNLLTAETYNQQQELTARENHVWVPIQVPPDCPRASI